MKSPCNKVCIIDERTGLCKGCLRTLDEIGRWGAMDDAQREQVLAQLEKRKSDFPEVPVPPLA